MTLTAGFWYFSNGLSTIATLYVLLTLLLFRILHSRRSTYEHPTRNYYAMLFWLSTTSFITAIYAFIAPVRGWCFSQGLVGHVADLSICFWYFLMAYELYLIIVYQEQRKPELLHRRWLFLCGGNWSLSLLFPLIGFFIHEDQLYSKEPELEWCFISSEFPTTIIVVYYVPQIMAWIACCFYTLRILKYTRIMSPDLAQTVDAMADGDVEQQMIHTRLRSESVVRKSALHSTQKRLVLYPSCFLLLFLTALIDRAYQWVTGEQQYVLVLIHTLFFPSIGFVNACLFCSSHNNRTLKIWYKLGNKLKGVCWLPCKYGYCCSVEDHPDDVATSSVQLVPSSSKTPLLHDPNQNELNNSHHDSQQSNHPRDIALQKDRSGDNHHTNGTNNSNSKKGGGSQSSLMSPRGDGPEHFIFQGGNTRIDAGE